MTSDDYMAKIKARGGESLPRVLETMKMMNNHFKECALYWAFPVMPEHVESMLSDLSDCDYSMWFWAHAYAYERLNEEQWEFRELWHT